MTKSSFRRRRSEAEGDADARRLGREVGAGIDPDYFAALQLVLGRVSLDPIEIPAAELVPALAEDYHQAA